MRYNIIPLKDGQLAYNKTSVSVHAYNTCVCICIQVSGPYLYMSNSCF